MIVVWLCFFLSSFSEKISQSERERDRGMMQRFIVLNISSRGVNYNVVLRNLFE